MATVGAQTKVIDLGGRMAMPGINDSHAVTAATLTAPEGVPVTAELIVSATTVPLKALDRPCVLPLMPLSVTLPARPL